MNLRTLPEQFLTRLTPPGVIEQDTRGVLQALLGGMQDRVEDLRLATDRLQELVNPKAVLPETGPNVVLVKYAGQGPNGAITRAFRLERLLETLTPTAVLEPFVQYVVVGGSLTYDETAYPRGSTFTGKEAVTAYQAGPGASVYRKDALYEFVSTELELDSATIEFVDVVTDQRSLITAYVAPQLAETIGARLYSDDIELQRRALQSHFPRLKLKGTTESYAVLGLLVGFDQTRMTPLWGRVSPRRPDDLGHAANEHDFGYDPVVVPTSPVTLAYDPWRTSDGSFYTWPPADREAPISADPESSSFYAQLINGANPYVKVTHTGLLAALTLSGTTATAVTTTPHGLVTGAKVWLRGASQPQYNGQFTATVTSTTTFTIDVLGSPESPATGTVVWAAHPQFTGPLTSLVEADLVVTALTPAPHGLESGTMVTVAGAAQTGYNGTYVVMVTSATSFEYRVSSTQPSSATGALTWSSAKSVFRLTGGAPHRKATAEIPGTGLSFTALLEGSSANGFALEFSPAGESSVYLKIPARLSKVNYRTSFFDLSLTFDLEKFRERAPDVPIERNPDTELGGGAVAPYRPWGGGRTAPLLNEADDPYLTPLVDPVDTVVAPRAQLREGTTQLDASALNRLGLDGAQHFDELRVATRFPRRVAFGFGLVDTLRVCPNYAGIHPLFVSSTSGLPGTVSGTYTWEPEPTDGPVRPITGDLVLVVALSTVLERGVSAQRFTGTLTGTPIYPSSLELWVGGVQISAPPSVRSTGGADTASSSTFGQILPIAGKVLNGYINYQTGEIELETDPAYTTLEIEVRYEFIEHFSSEADPVDKDLVHYGNSPGNLVVLSAATFHFKTGQYSITLESVDPSRADMLVGIKWRVTTTEKVRDEPHDLDKHDLDVVDSPRPQDELFGVDRYDFYDDLATTRSLVAGGELVDLDLYQPHSGERVDPVSRELTVLDHRGVEFDVVGFERNRDFPAQPIKLDFQERVQTTRRIHPGNDAVAFKNHPTWVEATPYVEGNLVWWQGQNYKALTDHTGSEPPSTDWELADPELYHVGLRHGVLVADPDRFFGPQHHKELVLWLPFDEHPRDNLEARDHSTRQATTTLLGATQDDRRWDPQHGWGLRLGPSTVVTASSVKELSTEFSLAFWLKLGATASPGTDVILDLWPLALRLDRAASTIYVDWHKTNGNVVQLYACPLHASLYTFLALTRSGDSFKFSSTVSTLGATVAMATVVETLCQPFDRSKFMVLRGGARDFVVRDMRLWRRTLSVAELEKVRRPVLVPTAVAYTVPFFKTVEHQLKMTLRVLESGWVVAAETYPSLLSPVHNPVTGARTTSTRTKIWPRLGRVTRYDDSGSYVGQLRYKQTGFWGAKDVTGTQWVLGRHGYRMLGDGRLAVSPPWTPDWLCSMFEAETGPATELAAWSLGRDLVWLKGGTTPTTAHTYVAEVHKTGATLVLKPTLNDLAGHVTLIANGSVYLGVHDVSGQPTVYVEGASTETTTPVYLYGDSELILDADTATAYARWDHKDISVSEPNLKSNGVLSFTNSESATAGNYRLILDAGNGGAADPAFRAFRIEVTVGGVTFPATLPVDRTSTTLDVVLTANLTNPWPLQLRWTNYADVTDQGHERRLVVHGFRLEKLESAIYQVTHNLSTVTVTKLSLTRTPGSLSPGAWAVGYSSQGTPVDFKHEVELVPTRAAVADILTLGTNDKRENTVFVSNTVPLLADPSPPTALTLGAVSITGGPAYNAGDTVDLSVAVTAGTAVTYVWTINLAGLPIFSAVTASPTLTGVVLGKGGLSQTVTVVGVDQAGNSDTSTSSAFDVTAAPVFTSITVTVNDTPVPYDTSLEATTADVTDVITWYEGPGETNEILDPAAYEVTVARQVYVVAEGTTGAKTTVAVALRSAVNQPPVATAYLSSTPTSTTPIYALKLGRDQHVYLNGFATDQDLVGDLEFTWEFLGATVTGSMVSVGPHLYSANQVDVDLSAVAAGTYRAVFTVTDGSGALSRAELDLRVSLNEAPVIYGVVVTSTSGALPAVPEGARVTYLASVSDPDGDPVTVAWRLNELSTDMVGNQVVVETSYSVTNTFNLASVNQSVLLTKTPIVPGSVEVFVTGQYPATDNGLGSLRPGAGVLGGSVNYTTGALSVNLEAPALVTVRFRAYYRTLTGFVLASDNSGGETTAPLTPLTVQTGPVISSLLQVDGVVRRQFSYTLESTPVTGQAPSFSVVGLPPGLVLTGAVVTGTPTVAGTYISTATLNWPPFTDTRQLIFTISEFDARPPAPLNLMAFNDGVNPRFTGAETAIEFRWSIADDTNDPLDENMPVTVLEFRTLADQLVDTETIEAGVDTFSYAMTRLLSKFGTAQTFTVRSYHERSGLRSTTFDTLTVRKVST